MRARTALAAYFITLHCFMAANTLKSEQQLCVSARVTRSRGRALPAKGPAARPGDGRLWARPHFRHGGGAGLGRHGGAGGAAVVVEVGAGRPDEVRFAWALGSLDPSSGARNVPAARQGVVAAGAGPAARSGDADPSEAPLSLLPEAAGAPPHRAPAQRCRDPLPAQLALCCAGRRPSPSRARRRAAPAKDRSSSARAA